MVMSNGRNGNVAEQLVGVGWHFPVRVDLRRPYELTSVSRARGGIAMSRYETDIEQAIRIIIGTRPGERRMRPTFGCQIHELVFHPVNANTCSMVSLYVNQALIKWEPRIENISVQSYPDPTSENTILIIVDYKVRSTNNMQNLVYPFYLRREQDL